MKFQHNCEIVINKNIKPTIKEENGLIEIIYNTVTVEGIAEISDYDDEDDEDDDTDFEILQIIKDKIIKIIKLLFKTSK